MNFERFTFVFEKFTDLLTFEFKVFCADTEDEIKRLLKVVETAQNLLEDVDKVQRQSNISNELRILVLKVMSILEEIEDFLDSFYQGGGGGGGGEGQQIEQGRVRGVVSRASHIPNNLKRKLSTVKWAIDIRDKLQDDVHCLKGYQLSSESPQFTRRQRLKTHPEIIREEFIVHLEEVIQTYLAQLLPGEGIFSKDLAILGMGGAGKTTTARVLYNHKRISEHFDKTAWVCVSQVWDTYQLLRQICRQVGVLFSDDGDVEKLILKLKAFLRKKSCFFVLDDVWEIKALQDLLPVLRSANSRGRISRVLVTTRNKNIFTSSQHDFSIRKIPPLTSEESQDLFVKTLRRNSSEDGEWYLEGEFVKLGEEMLQKCRGLPLAIIALSGLLSSKASIHEWQIIKNDVATRINRHKGGEDDYGVVRDILELSYFDLPYRLKPCFLYLGIFPEDSLIDVQWLIRLWIAEGFIKVDPFSVGSCTLEEIAMNFLDELGHRCMIEINANNFMGDIENIRIHDLIRELCIRKAKEWRLFEISTSSTSISTSMAQRSNETNRIIIHGRANSDIKSPRARSYIWMGGYPFDTSEGPHWSKFLRVLYLEGFHLRMPISCLVLLRYLELGPCSEINRECAESILKLRNLLTFICRLSSNIPDNMVGRMEHLRHLSLCNSRVISRGGRLGVDNKRELQVLRAPSGEWVTRELSRVSIGLQELHLSRISTQAQLEAIYDFVSSRSERLRTLDLSLQPPHLMRSEFDLQKLNSRHCASLKLEGKIRRQELMLFPPRLLYLRLESSQINDEEQLKKALAQLDELRCLHLYHCSYIADRLTMTGLPKLQVLILTALSELKEWRIETGALPNLHTLEIGSCPGLERLPTQIRHIGSLQLLSVCAMPATFSQRLQPPSESGDNEGEDFYLVRHISSHRFNNHSLFH